MLHWACHAFGVSNSLLICTHNKYAVWVVKCNEFLRCQIQPYLGQVIKGTLQAGEVIASFHFGQVGYGRLVAKVTSSNIDLGAAMKSDVF